MFYPILPALMLVVLFLAVRAFLFGSSKDDRTQVFPYLDEAGNPINADGSPWSTDRL